MRDFGRRIRAATAQRARITVSGEAIDPSYGWITAVDHRQLQRELDECEIEVALILLSKADVLENVIRPGQCAIGFCRAVNVLTKAEPRRHGKILGVPTPLAVGLGLALLGDILPSAESKRVAGTVAGALIASYLRDIASRVGK